MNSPYLLIALATAPEAVALALAKVPAERIDEALSDDRFNTREAIAHLADIEPTMRERMRQAVERPGSTIVSFDEGEWAIQNDYAHADLETSLQTYRRERQKTVDYLSALTDADWDSPAMHDVRGSFSVSEQAHQLVCHDLYHVDHLLLYGR